MDLIKDIINAWGWIGINPVKIVGENDFGNLIIEDRKGKYWRVCPEDIYCKVIAQDRQELEKLSKDQEFLVDWNMTALLDQARSTLGPLEDGRKYCLVIPSVFGGSYDVSNIKTVPFVELISLSGHLGQQIRDLPDGQKIELKIVD